MLSSFCTITRLAECDWNPVTRHNTHVADEGSETRPTSGALFGNASMARVLISAQHLAPDVGATTTARKIARDTGIVDSQVRAVLWRLVAAKMLDAVPKVGGPRSSQIFQRRDSPHWTAALALAASANGSDEALLASDQSAADGRVARSGTDVAQTAES